MTGPEKARHEAFMRAAIALAAAADRDGDVGVGCVIVQGDRIVGRGRNRIRTGGNPTLHAENEAIGDACRGLGFPNLAGCVLYTSMEPCPMCAGAIVLAGITRWVLGGRHRSIGRTDLGTYSVETFATFVAADVELTTGILQDECEELRKRWRP